MNLEQFIEYRLACPFCHNDLITAFRPLSGKRCQQRYEEGRLACIYDLNDYDRSMRNKYKIGYSFGLVDNSFEITFYETGEGITRMQQVPLFLLKRSVELHANLKTFRFYRECVSFPCRRYTYTTNGFGINLRHGIIPALEIWIEGFGLIHHSSIDERHRIFRLYNVHGEGRSLLYVPKNAGLRGAQVVNRSEHGEVIELPVIPVPSVEGVSQRLNDLLIFS